MLSEKELEARRKGIGGSDVVSVLSLEPYGCATKLYYDKTGVKADFDDINPHMERGIYLEDIVCSIYSGQTGNLITRLENVESKDHSFMLANVDRIISSADDEGYYAEGQGVLEVKCPNRDAFLRIQREGIPEAYILQGQHYMYVTGKKWMEYAIFCADLWKLEVIPVMRDEELINMIIQAEENFWTKVMEREQPDRLELEDKRCKKCNWRLHCWKSEWEDQAEEYFDEYEECDDRDFVLMIEEHKENLNLLKEAKVFVKASKKKLQSIIGDRKKLKCDEGKVCFQWETKTVMNATKLKKENPDIAKKYEYESGSKPLRFYPKKGK